MEVGIERPELQICDVRGAYLSRLDNDRRLADHLYGKMHHGYAQMRKSYESLQKELFGTEEQRKQPGGQLQEAQCCAGVLKISQSLSRPKISSSVVLVNTTSS